MLYNEKVIDYQKMTLGKNFLLPKVVWHVSGGQFSSSDKTFTKDSLTVETLT